MKTKPVYSDSEIHVMALDVVGREKVSLAQIELFEKTLLVLRDAYEKKLALARRSKELLPIEQKMVLQLEELRGCYPINDPHVDHVALEKIDRVLCFILDIDLIDLDEYRRSTNGS